LGITFDEYIEYMENDDFWENLISTALIIIVIGVVLYRVGKNMYH